MLSVFRIMFKVSINEKKNPTFLLYQKQSISTNLEVVKDDSSQPINKLNKSEAEMWIETDKAVCGRLQQTLLVTCPISILSSSYQNLDYAQGTYLPARVKSHFLTLQCGHMTQFQAQRRKQVSTVDARKAFAFADRRDGYHLH